MATEKSYKAGYDCGKNGPNTNNCTYSLFCTPELMAAWERGKRDAEKEKEASNTSQQSILSEVVQERQRQDDKFGAHRHQHPLEWLAILGEEFGEVSKAMVDSHFAGEKFKDGYTECRQELVQVAAVAVAIIEAIDSQKN